MAGYSLNGGLQSEEEIQSIMDSKANQGKAILLFSDIFCICIVTDNLNGNNNSIVLLINYCPHY